MKDISVKLYSYNELSEEAKASFLNRNYSMFIDLNIVRKRETQRMIKELFCYRESVYSRYAANDCHCVFTLSGIGEVRTDVTFKGKLLHRFIEEHVRPNIRHGKFWLTGYAMDQETEKLILNEIDKPVAELKDYDTLLDDLDEAVDNLFRDFKGIDVFIERCADEEIFFEDGFIFREHEDIKRIRRILMMKDVDFQKSKEDR